ncbi:putative NADPH dehydrogenase [Spathaspora sp. JA1]|nr:putative NADPH dehydrogenase [Spathaspora sp. JA1]
MTTGNLQSSNLFKSIKVGNTTLKHRIAHLPTTRNRAANHVPTDLMKQYYSERASSGGLIVTEATLLSLNQGLYPLIPGIFNETHAEAWKQITDAVHEQGGAISVQLGAIGRVSNAKLLKDLGLPLTGPSAIYENEQAEKDAIEAGNPIRALTEEEIKDFIYNQATNAVRLAEKAGFDFFELHGANGYFLEQFIHPEVNKRTGQYGGSIENRARLLLETIDHLSTIVDPSKLAVRLSPLNTFQVPNINESSEADYSYIVSELQKRADQGKGLGYISIIDGRFVDEDNTTALDLDYIHKLWKGVILRGGNYTYDNQGWNTIREHVDADDRTLIGFGRNFIANPDLPDRIRNGIPLNPYDRSTFYTPTNFGYNTYPHVGGSVPVKEEAEKQRFGSWFIQQTNTMTTGNLQSSNLFKAIKVGNTTLKHRIAHLPTTRNRAANHVPTDLMKQYYTERATSGGLLVTEATLVSLNQGIYPLVPGIFNETQSKAWKQITDSVHEQGGAISLQIWALGRVGNAKLLKDNGLPLTGPSANYEHEQAEKDAIEAGNPIKALTEEEIKDFIYNQYTNAIKLADKAGFDFFELHGANGYLFEQFIHPEVNQRTDKYGGSIENRARLLLETIDHLSTIVDPSKLALRLSPINTFQVPNVNPTSEADYSYIVSELQKRADQGKGLGYISIVDGRFVDADHTTALDVDYIHKLWKGVLLRGGNYTYDNEGWNAIRNDTDADDRTLVGFGRNFIANPDLPDRIRNGTPLNPYDRSTFYTPNNFGYNTYPHAGDSSPIKEEAEKQRFGVALA